MKQLNIFSPDHQRSVQWQLFIDGAARSNPGPAGAGIYLLKSNQLFLQKGFFLGNRTNNQAEYLALLIGLFFVQQYKHSNDQVQVVSDSELLVKQINKQYRVRDAELQKLYALAIEMMQHTHAVIRHVLRANNKHADAMANQGIDKRVQLPEEFVSMLAARAIIL